MNSHRIVRGLRAGSALSAVALAALSALATPVAAQSAVSPATPAPQSTSSGTVSSDTAPATALTTAKTPDSDAAIAGQEIVVTGSLFRSATTSVSPVTVLTPENLQKAGITNITDAVRSISADSAGSIANSFTSGFSAGGAAVSLRGVGVSSTLILVDGLRSTNFPLNDDGHNAYVDLNSIPITNIESIQVLKDGASSLYGADAIGGVVNIVTRKHITGVEGGAEGGLTGRGDGQKYKAHLAAGFGDYEERGFNVYATGEYEYDGRISNNSRGFPFNTRDLRSIGGVDQNRADDTLTQATPNAVVTRTTQTDLNNPLAGSVANATSPALFTSLTPLANCPYGTFSENIAARVGAACAHNIEDEYRQILPLQERYGFSARASLRISDSIEGYIAGSYTHDRVDIISPPVGIRQTQAFGASPALATSNPGIVLPVYICSAGINCVTAADRRLNPNNPYAAAFAANPAAGAARIYYLFGDVPSGSSRTNEVYRINSGLNGHFGDKWDWRVEGVYARDNLNLTDRGYFQSAALIQAINTGSYNFVDPSQNSQALRNQVFPDIHTKSNSWIATVDASLSHTFFTLPGGDVKGAIGGQFRRESLTNNSRNPLLNVDGLNTSAAFGARSVVGGYFEIDAPIVEQLDINVSGRYDHYSSGFNHFSPKVGVKFTPIPEISLRGTYSNGFRAPTFAESDARSSYAGFSNFTPPAAFQAAHASNSAYYTLYSLGSGATGNPNIGPEKSRSFTGGLILQPKRWFTFTADYFNIKKSNLIVAGPLGGQARTNYYSVSGNSYASAAAAQAAGCAALAATGPGYSCNVVDAADPFNANALPRLLVYNVPFVNSAYELISGVDLAANASIPITSQLKLNSGVEVTYTIQYDFHPGGGAPVQKYAGTLGPQELSSGNGTPRIRGNWQNTLTYNQFSLTGTVYYVGRFKEVAADEGTTDLSCASALYKAADGSDKFCHVRRFIYLDLNGTVQVSDKFQFFLNVGNVFGAHAPIAPASYSSSPNYLGSWHLAGLIGRSFRAGANFKF